MVPPVPRTFRIGDTPRMVVEVHQRSVRVFLLVLGVPALVAGERPVQHQDVLREKGQTILLRLVPKSA
jgi:hypothetical protein